MAVPACEHAIITAKCSVVRWQAIPSTLAKDDGESLAEALDGLPISNIATRRAGRWIDGTLRAATAQEWPHRVRTGDFAKRPVES